MNNNDYEYYILDKTLSSYFDLISSFKTIDFDCFEQIIFVLNL